MAEYVQSHSDPDAEYREQERTSVLWQFAEDVAGALLTPGRKLREIGEREAIVSAIALVVLVVGVGVSGQIAALIATFGRPTGAEQEVFGEAAGGLAAMQLSGILWNIVWGPVLWTMTAAGLYGVAYLLGGRGRFMSLWAASGFALAPQLLIAPLYPMNEALGLLGAGWQFLGWLFVLPFTLGAFIWTLVLLSIAVRETMSVSGGRAAASVAILVGVLLLLAILLICAFFFLIFALIAAVAS